MLLLLLLLSMLLSGPPVPLCAESTADRPAQARICNQD